MPTGYTEKLMSEGQSFNEFVLTCARAMGATIMMRDEPLGADIPEFAPSNHYAEKIEEFEYEFERLALMTDDEKLLFGESTKLARIEMLNKRIKKDQLENGRLIAMSNQVEAWEAPTEDHIGLKNFMLDQIRISKNDIDYYIREIEEAINKSNIDYYNKALEESKRSKEYYIEQQQKEIERTESRNKWVRELKESISKTNQN